MTAVSTTPHILPRPRAGVDAAPPPPAVSPPRRQAARVRFPARPDPTDWAATRHTREQVRRLLTRAPFVADNDGGQRVHGRGLEPLLGWLADQPGGSWQQRWLASGADAAGRGWREVSTRWMVGHGIAPSRQSALSTALVLAICADVVRPSLAWLVVGPTAKGALARGMARCRDPQGFARLRSLCAGPDVSPAMGGLTLHRSAVIVAAKGGALADITIGDVLQLLDTEAEVHRAGRVGAAVFYRLLYQMGIFGEGAPATLREIRATGQRTPEELIDRYRLVCRPVRDLLVDYLRERQPALDYNSLTALAATLGKLFWQDLERHHPGIDSLRLPVEVAHAWKQRLRTMTKAVTTAAGGRTEVAVARASYEDTLTRVRALYLDLAHWAVDDPARWGPWVAPPPIRAEETRRRKANRQRKSRIDARTRERLPVLPVLVRVVDQRRAASDALLRAARATPPGDTFTAAGQTLVRSVTPTATAGKVWAEDPATGRRRDLSLEDDHAFWVWATVEVLRATGVRIEEMLELSHHSLVRYRLPSTGELVPLLAVAPSKTDAERLLVVSPELAEVLSTIIGRVRDRTGAVPLVPVYDRHERLWSRPTPVLFQRRYRGENRAINPSSIRKMLATALAHTGLRDPDTGGPLRYTPHDFRRIFITDAVLNGLPPHIAQVLVGHQHVDATMGYKAVYPDEAIQAHLAFLARRRALRPSEEYRTPTDAEWQEFLGHFERRKVAIGTCARAFGTPCIHEHACIRCPMLWPDPSQRARLAGIRDNLVARIAEAEREGWLGEVDGLRVSLTGAEDKLAQMDRQARPPTTVELGMPGVRATAQGATTTGGDVS
jgi:hypothetical protein